MRLILLAAAFALPQAGVVDPGKSLGGLRVGMSSGSVRAAWGGEFGRCRGCRFPTWYFTYRRYAPQGVGVELRRGRVAGLFTVWSPPGWHTPVGLRIGDPSSRIGELYGRLSFVRCSGYDAYELGRARSVTSFYVVNGKVWGFGLSRPAVPECV